MCSSDLAMQVCPPSSEPSLQIQPIAADGAQEQRRGTTQLTLQPHQAYPQDLITGFKLLLLPYAMMAKTASDVNLLVEEAQQAMRDPKSLPTDVLPQVIKFWPRQASMVLGAYQDALNTMSAVTTNVMLSSMKQMCSFYRRR